MKVVYAKPLPKNWRGHPHAKGLLLDADLQIGTSRLRAKLLVFETCRALHKFWRHGLGKGNLGRRCRGAVNGLSVDAIDFLKDGSERNRRLEVDPRYFCVIGLVKGYLNMEIICHESVHAAYCYQKRIRRSPWDVNARDFDEEPLSYAVGCIAGAINRKLYAEKLYPKEQPTK